MLAIIHSIGTIGANHQIVESVTVYIPRPAHRTATKILNIRAENCDTSLANSIQMDRGRQILSAKYQISFAG